MSGGKILSFLNDRTNDGWLKVSTPEGEVGWVFSDDVEQVPDPAESDLEAMWNEEWENNLLVAATERVKRAVDPTQYQVFDLYAVKKWPARKVASALKVNIGRVYLAKHRIGTLIKREVNSLKTKPI